MEGSCHQVRVGVPEGAVAEALQRMGQVTAALRRQNDKQEKKKAAKNMEEKRKGKETEKGKEKEKQRERMHGEDRSSVSLVYRENRNRLTQIMLLKSLLQVSLSCPHSCSASVGGSSFQGNKTRLLHTVVQVAHCTNMPSQRGE